MPLVSGPTRRAVLAAMVLATASRAAARPGDGKIIRFVPSEDLPLLDPLGTTSYTVRNYGLLVFDTLYALDCKRCSLAVLPVVG